MIPLWHVHFVYGGFQGVSRSDLGGGVPSVIIADLAATAALAAAARAAPVGSFYHHSRLLLFLDEPNMGVQLDGEVGHG